MKALIGSWDQRPHHLLAEITALRTKVAELEAELAAVRAENEVLRNLGEVASDVLATTSA